MWYEEGLFCQLFPRLYNLSKIKFSSVRMFVESWQSNDSSVNILWSRQLRAWELKEVLKLNSMINSLVFSSGSDHLVWSVYNQPYSMQAGRLYLRSCLEALNTGIQGDWNITWNLKIPPKIMFFLWKLEHKILPSKVMLTSRMHNWGIDKTCVLCNKVLRIKNTSYGDVISLRKFG